MLEHVYRGVALDKINERTRSDNAMRFVSYFTAGHRTCPAIYANNGVGYIWTSSVLRFLPQYDTQCNDKTLPPRLLFQPWVPSFRRVALRCKQLHLLPKLFQNLVAWFRKLHPPPGGITKIKYHSVSVSCNIVWRCFCEKNPIPRSSNECLVAIVIWNMYRTPLLTIKAG